jgi:hypothetical protein
MQQHTSKKKVYKKEAEQHRLAQNRVTQDPSLLAVQQKLAKFYRLFSPSFQFTNDF